MKLILQVVFLRGGDGIDDTNPRTLGSGPNGGYLQNDEDSGITVSFEFADGVILSESAKISWNLGDLRIIEVTEDAAKIKLFDMDMNLNPESVDTVYVDVFSDDDGAGIDLQITETTENSGIFEGLVYLTKNDQSSGNRLYALPDSEIIAKYSDRTLPRPYNTSDDLDVFAKEVVITKIPSTERLIMEEIGILGQTGDSIEDLVVGLLSWVTGQTMPSQELGMSVSWIPEKSGKYLVERFVWNSIKGAIPLTDTVTYEILVK